MPRSNLPCQRSLTGLMISASALVVSVVSSHAQASPAVETAGQPTEALRREIEEVVRAQQNIESSGVGGVGVGVAVTTGG